MNIEVNKVDSGKQLDAVFSIRQVVFVEEQRVDPALEYDEFEETSTHFIAYVDKVPAGTARWRKTPNGIKLERFAVLKNFRNKGVGGELIQTVLDDLPSKMDVYLHSQVKACNLYKRFGFVQEGQQFEEANIQHYKMTLKK